MNRQTIPLGRILGIPVGLDPSWFLIFVLLTWTLATGFYPLEFKDWPVAQYWGMGAVTAILLFVSVLLHELAHSVVALRYKIPVRSITLHIFGGVSQIEAEPRTAGAEFWIAIAGPATSFILALLFGVLAPALAFLSALSALFRYLSLINLALGVFNLIPGLPLDGGGVFRSIVWGVTHDARRATLIAGNLGRLIAYLLIIWGVWQALNGSLLNGLWIAFIGWFLESAAVAQVQQQRLQDVLAGHTVRQAMHRNYTIVSPDTTLETVVNDHILGGARRSLIVEDNKQVVGLLTVHHVKEIPRADWPTVTVGQAMIQVEQMKRVQPDAELWSALQEMDRDGVSQLPVMTDGQIEGMLGRDDIIGFLRTLADVKA